MALRGSSSIRAPLSPRQLSPMATSAVARRRSVHVRLEYVSCKNFSLRPEQRHRVDARWEVQNLTNTVNYSGVGTLGSRYFGEVTSAGAMRTMDLMIRFNF